MSKYKNKIIIAVIVIVSFFMCVMMIPVLYIALSYLEPYGYLPAIQTAIESQCPQIDTSMIDVKGYGGDPVPSWLSEEVSCYRNMFDEGWTCNCE